MTYISNKCLLVSRYEKKTENRKTIYNIYNLMG